MAHQIASFPMILSDFQAYVHIAGF